MLKHNPVKDDIKYGLLSLFDHHNREMQKKVETEENAKSTLTKYITIRNRFSEFIREKYDRDDIYLSNISSSILEEFHAYLLIEKKMTHNNIVTYIEMLGKIFRIAYDRDLLQKNQRPYYQYRKMNVTSSDYLTIEELHRLERLRSVSEELRYVYRLFMFSCYTGAAYQELKWINTEDIVEEDGFQWFTAEGREHWEIRYVPLYFEAEDCIEFYEELRNEMDSELIFPLEFPSSPDRILNEIAKNAGIHRPISFNTAVGTFLFSYALTCNFPKCSYDDVVGMVLN